MPKECFAKAEAEYGSDLGQGIEVHILIEIIFLYSVFFDRVCSVRFFTYNIVNNCYL
jgi:hypothetical protein